MKLLESTKKEVDQDKDGKNVPKLESAEVFLVQCNLVNNNFQQASKVLFNTVPNKQLGQLMMLNATLKILNATNTELSSIEVWFTDQNGKPLEIEDNINMKL